MFTPCRAKNGILLDTSFKGTVTIGGNARVANAATDVPGNGCDPSYTGLAPTVLHRRHRTASHY